MNVIVTGSEGYIGKELIKLLISKGINVFPFDVKISINKNKKNINYRFLKENNISCIVDLAAISGIAQCQNNIEEFIDKNINDSISLINETSLCNKLYDKDIKYLFISSQAAKSPSNLYSISKRTIEKYLNKSDVRGMILRLSNVYGGDNYLSEKTSVVAKLINSIKNNEDFIINGDGTQIRNFIHVEDVVLFIYYGILNNIPKYTNSIFDVGSNEELSINDLVKLTLSKTDNRFNIVKDLRNDPGVSNNTILFNVETNKKYNTFIIDNFKKLYNDVNKIRMLEDRFYKHTLEKYIESELKKPE